MMAMIFRKIMVVMKMGLLDNPVTLTFGEMV
jgi:hypothetical protein